MTSNIAGPRRNLFNVHNRVSFGVFSVVMGTELTGGEKGSWKLKTQVSKDTVETGGGMWQKNVKYKGSFLRS